MNRSPASSCPQGSCQGCPSAGVDRDCAPEEGLRGPALVLASAAGLLLPVGLALVAALWAGPRPALAAPAGLGGLALGWVLSRPLLRRIEERGRTAP